MGETQHSQPHRDSSKYFRDCKAYSLKQTVQSVVWMQVDDLHPRKPSQAQASWLDKNLINGRPPADRAQQYKLWWLQSCVSKSPQQLVHKCTVSAGGTRMPKNPKKEYPPLWLPVPGTPFSMSDIRMQMADTPNHAAARHTFAWWMGAAADSQSRSPSVEGSV